MDLLSTEVKDVIVLGDFNCDFFAKRSTHTECKQLKSLFRIQGYTQLIDSPTRIAPESSTLLDLIVTNRPQIICFSGVVGSSLSDHELN
jgi:endonuclease/exonuclease/phosphatase family metal-dependent hydrolase